MGLRVMLAAIFGCASAMRVRVEILGFAVLMLVSAMLPVAHAAEPVLMDVNRVQIEVGPENHDSWPDFLTNVNGTLYFRADDGVSGFELWKTDGTVSGTDLVRDLYPGSGDSFVHNLTYFNNALYFTADDGVHGYELWKSDGTVAGTVLVKDIFPGSVGSSPGSLAVLNASLYFRANDGAYGCELWKSDGTEAGTVMVKDIYPGGGESCPKDLMSANGVLYFRAQDGVNGDELWKSDGTAGGTVLVKDIKPGIASSFPTTFTQVNGAVFFLAQGVDYDIELWKTDGTAAGTVQVKDIRPGAAGSYPVSLTEFNGWLYFVADDGVSGSELWKSDGTEVGTVMVKDIRPGSSGWVGGELVPLYGALYFAANDGTRGRELWKTDGTAAGTVLVKDINPGSNPSEPTYLLNANSALYFSANDVNYGRELWKTDGTAAGTVRVTDIYPESGSSDAKYLLAVNDALYFAAGDGLHGTELWMLAPDATPSPTPALIPQSQMTVVSWDSQETTGEDGRAVNVLDGSASTIWHTEWYLQDPLPPHEIVVDLGAEYDVSAFKYLPRAAKSGNGRIKDYQFYVSNSLIDWGTVAASGTFPNTATEQTKTLPVVRRGRYVRLVALNEVNGNPWSSMAEFNVIGAAAGGTPNQAPNGVINTPAANVTITAGQSVNFTATGSDPDGNTPLSYSWNFGGGAANSNVEDPGTVVFNTLGVYTVTLNVTDSLGLSDPTPATVQVTVNGSIPNQAPDGVINTPSANVTITAGQSVNFTSTGSDPDGNTPLGYTWNFGGGATSTNAEDPGAVVFNTAGVYTVTLTVTDSLGLSDPTPPTVQVTVNSTTPSPTPALIPQSQMTLVSWDSQETAREDGRAINVLDGNAATIWHTEWSAQVAPLPHEIVVDLGGEYDVTRFRYLPRQNSANGRIAGYQFFVSNALDNWGSAAAAGTFPNTATAQTVTLANARRGRYVRLVALSEVNGNPWTSMAEFNVIGALASGVTPNQAPNGVIDAPAANVTITAGQSVNFTATGSDPDGNTPLSYSWNFGGGAANSTLEDPGVVVFSTPGAYTVTLTVTDSLGLADPTPASVQVTVTSGSVASGPLPKSTWTLHYVDSQELARDGLATYAFDGNPATLWHTQWFNGSPRPPHEIQINLGAVYEVDGFRYLPRQDLLLNGRIDEFEFYVSLDGVNWGAPVAAGRFANDLAEKEVLFPRAPAQYVRLVALNEVNGNAWTSVAEIGVLGLPFAGNLPPNGTISSPASSLSIAVGASVAFAGTGSDPDGHTPLSFAWDFAGVAPASDQQNPGSVVFDAAGTYVVTLTVTDGLGRGDPTPAQVVVKVGEANRIGQGAWSLLGVDSQASAATPGVNAFDGDTQTYWQSASTAFPHEIRIDLGMVYSVDELAYLPRQNGSTAGRLGSYKIYVSDDGQTWGAPVFIGTLANTAAEQRVLFPPKFGQFIRLVGLSAASGGSEIAASEINVGGVCQVPYVRLLEPKTDDLQSQPGLSARAAACLNPALHAGWGVQFRLNGTVSEIDTIAPYSAEFAGAGLTNHLVEARIVDEFGVLVDGPYTVDVATDVGVGDYLVAIGDSITAGFGDTIASDNVSTDGRNWHGGFTPILSDALSTARGYPVLVQMEAIPGYRSAQGLARLPLVLERHPESQTYLLLYGTNDSGGSLPVPSGLGLSPGDTGYPGSFKANMQQMIDLIGSHAGGGKQAYLAKIPYSKTTSLNPTIQQYNLVIDELAAQNAIAVTPPDFYSFFQANQSQYTDTLHPNGVGYQSMSTLWFNSLQ